MTPPPFENCPRPIISFPKKYKSPKVAHFSTLGHYTSIHTVFCVHGLNLYFQVILQHVDNYIHARQRGGIGLLITLVPKVLRPR